MKLSERIECLDQGYVSYVDHMGNDGKIVNAARQSYAGKGSSADKKLITYLMNNEHNTPFEHCVVTVEIRAPIFVIRQWHRHRTQSYSEVSGRYVELDMGFYTPNVDSIGEQSTTNHQGRDIKAIDPVKAMDMVDAMVESNMKSNTIYKELLDAGCPREIARSVLPVSTYSQYWATANLHNWMKFLWERLDSHAQYEIRVYAYAVLRILEDLYPITMEQFIENFAEAGRDM